MEQAARALGLKLQVLNVTSASDLDAAFKVLDQKRADALFLIADPLFTQHRDKIQVLATNYSIPTMHSSREGVAAGGLMSYGTDVPDVVRQAGIYIGRILKGAKPAPVPVASIQC